MKRRYFLVLLIFSLAAAGRPAAAFDRGIVSNTTQPSPLTIPDSLDRSKDLYNSLVRSERFTQFNRLIGLYLNFAMDSLKKGRMAAAEKIMLSDALPMLSHYGDGYNMYHSFMTLGKSYHQQKKFTQAKWFFIQSMQIAKKISYESGELFSLIELAKVKEAINDKNLALQDYKAAALLATRINFTSTLASIKKNIVRLDAVAKNDTVLPVLQASKN